MRYKSKYGKSGQRYRYKRCVYGTIRGKRMEKTLDKRIYLGGNVNV
jgi:hypothetical protein